MAKKGAADEAKVKKDLNKRKKANMIRQRAADEDKLKEDQNRWKNASMIRQGQKMKIKSKRNKIKGLKGQQVKEDKKSRQQKQRRIENKSDRLKRFREATMYNAIFICTCCQQRMFHSNARLYNI